MIYPGVICLRYCKLAKFRYYQAQIDDFLVDIFQNYTDRQTIKSCIDMGDVIEKLAFVSHITACLWMYIGSK